jgi:archaellum component FlaC
MRDRHLVSSRRTEAPVHELLAIVSNVLEEAKKCGRLITDQARTIEALQVRVKEMECKHDLQSKQIGIVMDELYRATEDRKRELNESIRKLDTALRSPIVKEV